MSAGCLPRLSGHRRWIRPTARHSLKTRCRYLATAAEQLDAGDSLLFAAEGRSRPERWCERQKVNCPGTLPRRTPLDQEPVPALDGRRLDQPVAGLLAKRGNVDRGEGVRRLQPD